MRRSSSIIRWAAGPGPGRQRPCWKRHCLFVLSLLLPLLLSDVISICHYYHYLCYMSRINSVICHYYRETQYIATTVDGCEILHQLMVNIPLFVWVSTCFNHPKLVVYRISQPSTVSSQQPNVGNRVRPTTVIYGSHSISGSPVFFTTIHFIYRIHIYIYIFVYNIYIYMFQVRAPPLPPPHGHGFPFPPVDVGAAGIVWLPLPPCGCGSRLWMWVLYVVYGLPPSPCGCGCCLRRILSSI